MKPSSCKQHGRDCDAGEGRGESRRRVGAPWIGGRHVKIVVAVKSVARLDDEFGLLEDASDVDPHDLEFDLNEWDDFAHEAALALREQVGGGEVLVVTVGDEDSEGALRSCLAKGADRAMRIWDEVLEEADPMAVARVLAAAVEREEADLVLCGVQSSDAANGATGAALAGFADLRRIAVVRALAYDEAGSTLTVERELEDGLVEVLRVRTPALLTIQTGINRPRYANLRAIKQAVARSLSVITLAELGLDQAAVAAATGARSRGLAHTGGGDGAEMLGGGAAEVAPRIVEIVRSRLAS